jgi:predicted AlkP superfamily pyrophosphatase or phosphodiesterase
MRRTVLVTLMILAALGVLTQARAQQPKLVVAISVDQFPYDYIQRFRNHFSDGGFDRFLSSGAVFTNAAYGHAVTLTGPGHAVLLTGTYGHRNGIVANSWYDRASKRNLYCVEDSRTRLIGVPGTGRSPANLATGTYGDQLRIAGNFSPRVISVSGKDRAAVLMGGKLASAAYWMEDSVFTTSTYYADRLPDWVNDFNASGRINAVFGRTWERALPEEDYGFLGDDDQPFEEGGNGLGRAFPHPVTGGDASRLTGSFYDALMTSPFGNELVLEFAKEAVRAEQLGQRGVTDLLCISLSSNDYVGHAFGPHSHEAMDMTVQTDRQLAGFFSALGEAVGLDNCLIVLSSDHGVAPVPEWIRARYGRMEAKRVDAAVVKEAAGAALTKLAGAPPKGIAWIEAASGGNIYLNRDALLGKKVALEAAARAVAAALGELPVIAGAYAGVDLRSQAARSTLAELMSRSYHPARNGDVVYAYQAYLFEGRGTTGSTHGSPHSYDRHVPVMLLGRGVRKGMYAGEASPADIAPTLSFLTGTEVPPSSEGRVLTEALEEGGR